MNIREIVFFERLEELARSQPETTALVCEDKQLKYRELPEIIRRLLNGMLEEGIEKGERIALLMDNCNEYLLLIAAAINNRYSLQLSMRRAMRSPFSIPSSSMPFRRRLIISGSSLYFSCLSSHTRAVVSGWDRASSSSLSKKTISRMFIFDFSVRRMNGVWWYF